MLEKVGRKKKRTTSNKIDKFSYSSNEYTVEDLKDQLENISFRRKFKRLLRVNTALIPHNQSMP